MTSADVTAAELADPVRNEVCLDLTCADNPGAEAEPALGACEGMRGTDVHEAGATDLHWVRVTACSNVPIREGRPVQLGGREIALFNLGDRFLATDNRCPHKGGPLSDGIVTGAAVVCPLHAWKIDLQTGTVTRPAAGKDACVHAYPTRIDDGIVSVGLPLPEQPLVEHVTAPMASSHGRSSGA
jgi:nitrite reductase (NADH) small subunit